MFGRLFARSRKDVSPFAIPDGTRVYAIGDIHGRCDLLTTLHAAIADDMAQDSRPRNVVVYLGDYVDRGLESRQVVDLILDAPVAGAESVHLRGNHEDIMLMFLDDPARGPSWFTNGGDATLFSYGIERPRAVVPPDDLARLQAELEAVMPERHLAFLKGLNVYHVEGDYLFVHAGIRPGRPIERQDRLDLMWIRDEFLASEADHGLCVVHGHSISMEVDQRPNRIGIDTGAYFSGRLTCLVLEGDTRRLIST